MGEPKFFREVDLKDAVKTAALHVAKRSHEESLDFTADLITKLMVRLMSDWSTMFAKVIHHVGYHQEFEKFASEMKSKALGKKVGEFLEYSKLKQ